MMCNTLNGAECLLDDVSHLGVLAGQIGSLITISNTQVIDGDSCEMVALGSLRLFLFFFQAEDGIRDYKVTGVQTCALPIYAKLDGRLAQALMSIPAVKGVELGLGFEAARRKGSEVHDEILPGLARATNR